MSWVIVILGFCVLIILHELGHFTAAKAVGMRVEKFSLFFPPTIWSKKKGETEYAIGVIPAGGYVRITGMNPDEHLPDDVRDRAYHAQPVWKRMAVIAAGPAVNFLLALVLLFVAFWAFTSFVPLPRVAAVQPHSPAAGVLQKGDTILSVDGKTGNPLAFRTLISKHACAGGAKKQGCPAVTPVTLSVRRHGQVRTLQIRPRYDQAEDRPLVGFLYAEKGVHYSASKAASSALNRFWFITRETLKLPSYIFNSHKRKQISGIVGTSNAAHQAVAADAGDAVFLFAVISLSLAIINLFPFLPLDGGHIFWAAVEFVRRRPVPYAVMERAGVLGFMLVIGLFILGLTNDINRLTNGPGP